MSRHALTRKQLLTLMFGIGGAVTTYAAVKAARETRVLSETALNVGLPGLPKSIDGLRIVFLTDLHFGPDTPTSTITNAVNRVLQLAPDLILLGGDYIQWSMQHLSGVLPLLATLRAPLGVFGVLGNHDYYQPDLLSERLWSESRVQTLRNTGVDLGNGLYLCGIEDTWRGRFDADRALENRRDGMGTIALSHNPVGINLFRNIGALVLSGHTHGGQILIPGVEPHRAPGLGDFPILQGWYSIGQTAGFVSRGIGQTAFPLRFNCPPELVIITLSGLSATDNCKAV